MSKKLSRILALALALTMVFALVACGNNQQTPQDQQQNENPEQQPEQQPEERDTRLAAEVYPETFDPAGWYDESEALYNEVLGEYYKYYQEALQAKDLSQRYALFALAEGKLLTSGMFLPTRTRGGNYALSRVVPRTANTTLWGNDNDRYYKVLVATDFILPADRDEIKAQWAELKGTGTFEEWVRGFMAEKGYTLSDSYSIGYASDPMTWDPLNTYRSADSEAIVNTYDGLLEYNIENVQVPALAASYDVSDDGTVYTFHIREGVSWVDSQGRKVADVTADDWVAGMQHLLDAQGGLETLAADDGAKIKNAQAYIDGDVTDFAEVGVKAVDAYTLEYTLEEDVPFFTSMLGYNIFAPMSRSYYASQGGKFGAEFEAEADSYLYGKDPDHIAYCGPYLVTNATEKNTIVFKANPSYWNKDAVNVQTLTWLFNDGTDALKAYNDALAGTIAGAGLNSAALEAAKKDGNFDKYCYVSDTEATTFCGFLNVNRKQFANFNDPSVAASTKTVSDAERATAAMQNVHFRRALVTAVDRATYNAQTSGEELKLNSLRNSYVPATFVQLPGETTVTINGTATTFPAGTNYGEIMQAQIDADGVEIKVWDPEADSGIGSGDGYDGWYNVSYSNAEMAKAAEELAAQGVTFSAEDPIILDLPAFKGSEAYYNQANAFKQSVEATSGGAIIVNLLDCESSADWYYAGYYPDYGYEINGDITDVSGWGPDYGDPQTYLATITPAPGGMAKNCGMY